MQQEVELHIGKPAFIPLVPGWLRWSTTSKLLYLDLPGTVQYPWTVGENQPFIPPAVSSRAFYHSNRKRKIMWIWTHLLMASISLQHLGQLEEEKCTGPVTPS